MVHVGLVIELECLHCLRIRDGGQDRSKWRSLVAGTEFGTGQPTVEILLHCGIYVTKWHGADKK